MHKYTLIYLQIPEWNQRLWLLNNTNVGEQITFTEQYSTDEMCDKYFSYSKLTSWWKGRATPISVLLRTVAYYYPLSSIHVDNPLWLKYTCSENTEYTIQNYLLVICFLFLQNFMSFSCNVSSDVINLV